MVPLSDDWSALLALALPLPELDLTLEPDSVVLSRHAVRRYRERVEAVPRRLAAHRIRHLVATAQWRSRPLPCCPSSASPVGPNG